MLPMRLIGSQLKGANHHKCPSRGFLPTAYYSLISHPLDNACRPHICRPHICWLHISCLIFVVVICRSLWPFSFSSAGFIFPGQTYIRLMILNLKAKSELPEQANYLKISWWADQFWASNYLLSRYFMLPWLDRVFWLPIGFSLG